MRLFAAIILMVLSTSSLADHIRCYSAGKQIFSGYADIISSIDGVYMLERNNSKKVIFVTGDCVGTFVPQDAGKKS
jgi:hypothetical protein